MKSTQWLDLIFMLMPKSDFGGLFVSGYSAAHFYLELCVKKTVLACACILSVLLTGCASVIKGTQDTITVNSLEKGTIIYVDGVKRGIDDAVAQVNRGNTHTIKVSKEGCEDIIIETGESFDATSLLGILIDFGIITIPVDLISGAAWKTSPTLYTVTPMCHNSES